MPPEVIAEHLRHRGLARWTTVAFALLLLVMLSLPEFPVFGDHELGRLLLVHTLFELFAIVVCVMVAVVAWYTLEHEQIPSANVVIAGFTTIAGLDLAHTLAYEGMPAFLGAASTQHAVFFWLAARSVETLTLAAIALRLRLHGARSLWLVVAVAGVLLLCWLGTAGSAQLPALFVPGQGVTPLKRGIEFALFGLHLPVAMLFWVQARRHGQPWMRLLAAAALIGGMGELAFSSYHTPSAFLNVFGHLFKMTAYVLIFRGIYITALRLPYRRLERVERELAASVNLLELFIRHTPAAVAVLDRDLVYLQASDRWISDYKLQGQELIGRNHYEVFPDLPERWKAVYRRVLQGVPERCEEEPYERADGSTLWLQWEVRPWPDVDGSIGGLILFTQVITEQVTARHEIERLNSMLEHRVHERTRELQRVNAELEEFAASVSHDLQAPLRSIDGYAAMLREDAVDLGDETSRKLKVIVAETARAQGLIGDLLRLARLSRTELRASAVDLTALAQEVIDSLASDCAQRAVVWQLQPLPTVDVDRGLFRQALVNLLANAVKFTAGRDPAVIRIESLPDLAQPGECVLCISDNGAGFDMRYLKRLFGTFQRLHNDREFQGTGVGLANVKRIVERHGGRVWAEGKPGEGARFYIGIPLVSTQD